MTFIHFVTGKPSGILSDIPSGILSGISSGISSDILSGIPSGILSGILSGKHSGTLSGIPTGILSDILSGIPSGILSGISSGISSGILSGISFDILSDISSDILSGISSDILSGISSDILSDILSGILSGRSSDILSDIFSDILPVEVRQCPLRSGSRGWGPAVPTATWKSRLRSGSAHCDLQLAVEVRVTLCMFFWLAWIIFMALCKNSLSALGPQNYIYAFPICKCYAFLNVLLGHPLCLTTTHEYYSENLQFHHWHTQISGTVSVKGIISRDPNLGALGALGALGLWGLWGLCGFPTWGGKPTKKGGHGGKWW